MHLCPPPPLGYNFVKRLCSKFIWSSVGLHVIFDPKLFLKQKGKCLSTCNTMYHVLRNKSSILVLQIIKQDSKFDTRGACPIVECDRFSVGLINYYFNKYIATSGLIMCGMHHMITIIIMCINS